MQIKQNIYKSLTPEQRSAAMVEAQARGDEEEIRRLNETSPQRVYDLVNLSEFGLPNAPRHVLTDVLREISGKTAGLPVPHL